MRSKTNYGFVNKERVVIEFENTCEQVGAAGLVDVRQDSPLVRAVDRVLQHGLRDPVRGYWSLVRSLTHSSTLKALEAFVKYISSSHQKGLAWTLYTLGEGSLEYYLSSLLQDTDMLQQHYQEQSVVRDPALAARVVNAITTLRAEAAIMQASMESSLVSEAPLDPPSLSSPVDSGVALVDSDSSTSDGEKTEGQSSEPGESWEQVLGISVPTEASSSTDNTLADYSDRDNANNTQATDNKHKTGIIAQNKYDGVCRRRKKKKSEPSKRVSFHQDSNDDKSNLNKLYVEGRYSWAGEDDSVFAKEKENFRLYKSEIYERKGLSSTISIFDSEMGIEADCDSSTTTLDEAKHNLEAVCEKLTNVVKQSLGLKMRDKALGPGLPERGAPEGQEDPAEYERLVFAATHRSQAVRSSMDLTSDSEWSMDTPDQMAKRNSFIKHPGSQRSIQGQPSWPARILQEAPSKTSLVKRFLRSIPTRKPYKEKKPAPRPNLYIRGVKPDPALAAEVERQLETELRQREGAAPEGGGDCETVTEAMTAALQETVLLTGGERIYKVYRVSSTEGIPLLAVLTDSALYVTGLNQGQRYSRRHHISYPTLDTVVVGPEYQTVMLVTVDHSVRVTVISALGQALVTHMVSHLAVAVYRAARTHLSVKLLSLSNMHDLYKALHTNTSVTKDEKLHYYRYIRVEDRVSCSQSLTKCGHLMYRPHSHSPWLPGYIVLKGGVLSVFSDCRPVAARHVLSLHRGYFGGCRRVLSSSRPHTFEVLPFSQRGLYGTFQFAAADDYEASDWLQAFIQTSATMCDSPVDEGPLLGCGLLLTSRHLLTLDFPHTVLSCARLQDITSVRTVHTCCILETSCREVQDGGGDWNLYFLTEQAISEFLDTLYQLRPQLHLSGEDSWESETLLSHCSLTSQTVRAAWDPLLRPSCAKQSLR